ncbi:MAG: hypothetical protein JKY56_09690 [Kofleriaceae bacterium]|nr:hypothetical protein [Kofleriaceae bacterium]
MLETLCCPESHGELVYVPAGVVGDKELLYCAQSSRTYPIDNGLPVLLADEATLLDKEQCAAIDKKVAELARK